MTSPERLDLIQTRAELADQGEYKAADRTDIYTDVPWDDEADQPVRLWWVDRPGWVEDAGGEALFYSEADARYAEVMHPKVALALVAEIRRFHQMQDRFANFLYSAAVAAEVRAARDAREDLHELQGDLDAMDLTAASAHKLDGILRRWDKATAEDDQ
jgi:hypothetical protein